MLTMFNFHDARINGTAILKYSKYRGQCTIECHQHAAIEKNSLSHV